MNRSCNSILCRFGIHTADPYVHIQVRCRKMGLDITIMERKDVRCPHCGEVINTVDVSSTDSGGRLWYDFLERLGYYVPYERRTKENDWYGKDMVLDNEQAKQLADYAVKKEVYNWDGVEWIVTEALAHGNKVVINADW